MKPFLLSIGLLLLTCQYAVAQDNVRIGGKLLYGSEIENLGIGATAEIPVMDKLVIAPDISFYFPKSDRGVKTNIFELNANGNYYFLQEDNISVYGLGGLNYTHVKAKYDNDFVDDSSDGEFGLNIGGGANFEIGQSFLPFAEIKYVLGDFDQLVIAAGVKFNID